MATKYRPEMVPGWEARLGFVCSRDLTLVGCALGGIGQWKGSAGKVRRIIKFPRAWRKGSTSKMWLTFWEGS